MGHRAPSVDVMPGVPLVLQALNLRVPGMQTATHMARREAPAAIFHRWLPRKEVIQPQLPLRLPCYDFTPIADPTFDGCLPEG